MPFGTITATESTFGSISGSIVGANVPGTLSGSVGVPGPQGPQGIQGIQGPPGPAGPGSTWGGIAGTISDQTDLWTQLGLKAPLASPAFTGNPTAPTAALGDNDTSLATTAFVQQELLSGTANAKNLEVYVRNQTGSTIPAGSIVYINGATGNRPTITLAQANNDANSAQTFGFTKASIANNGFGYVIVRGELENVDTSALTEGVQLYLSPTTAGTWTTTKPSAPQHLVYVGICVRAHPTQGVILVAVQNGYEVGEIHDIQLGTLANNDLLAYESSTDLWKNKTFSALGLLTSANLTGYATESWVTAGFAPIARGLPDSGTVGQVLTKQSGSSYDSAWQTLIPGDRYVTTSASTLTIGTGSKSLTIGTGLAYTPNQDVTVSLSSDPTLHHMHGPVTSYNSGTGALVMNVQSFEGSGTYSSWVVNVGGTVPLETVEWGEVLGTLGDQTDLATALNAKLETSTAASTYAALAGANFTGLVGTVASTTASAGLRVPHGVAPTTPVNGDIWTTTGNIQWRRNGGTQSLPNLGTSNTFSGGAKQTVSHSTTTAGFNIGPVASDPSTLVNGDVWHNLTSLKLRARVNGVSENIALESWVSSQGYITSSALTPYLTKADNLASVASVSEARDNLGLGSLSSPTFSGVTAQGSGANVANLTPTSLSLTHATSGTFTIQPSVGITFPDATVQTTAYTGGAGSVAWGSITGTLSSQTDLQTALNGKRNTSGIVSVNAGEGVVINDGGIYPNEVVLDNGGLVIRNGTTFTSLATFKDDQVLIPSVGITFSDATTQTTAGIGAAAVASTYQTISGMSSYATKASPALTGNVTITSNSSGAALFIEQSGTGNILTLHDQASDTSFVAIDQNGKLNTVPATTSSAGFNIAQGSSGPTTPVNGDMWTTAAGLFIHVNGATISPLTLAGGTFTGLVSTPASTTTNAGFRITPGTAPTTPVSGDVWITTGAGGVLNFRNQASVQTVPTLGLSNTFTNTNTFSGTTLNFGSGTAATTIGLGNGATASGSTKAVNIGTAGLSGSTTAINIGSAVSGATSTTTLSGTVNATTPAPGTNNTQVATTAFVTAAIPAIATVAQANSPSSNTLAMSPDKVRQMMMFQGFQEFIGGGSVGTSGTGANAPTAANRWRQFISPNASTAGYSSFVFDTQNSAIGFVGSKRGVNEYGKNFARPFWMTGRTIIGTDDGGFGGDANNLYRCELGGRNSMATSGDPTHASLGWRVAGGGSQAIVFYMRSRQAVNGGTYAETTTSFSPVYNQWFDWLVTYNGTDTCQMFVNDTLVGTISANFTGFQGEHFNFYSERIEQTASAATRMEVNTLPPRIFFSE